MVKQTHIFTKALTLNFRANVVMKARCILNEKCNSEK